MISPRRLSALLSPAALLSAAAVFVGAANDAHAVLLTYWNFNNVSPAYSAPSQGSFRTTAASYGEQYVQTNNSTPGQLLSNTSNSTVFNGSSIYIDFANVATITAVSPTINGKTPTAYTGQNITGGSAGFGTFSGSTSNGVGTDVAGDSLLLLNTSGNFNNKYLTFSLSSAGYESLSVTYVTRLTNSVTASQVWSYSTDGISYTPLTTLTPTANATFTSQSLNLSSLSSTVLDNKSSFFLRMTYTSPNAQGSQAFDNFQLNGTAIVVPEPSSYAALGGFAVLGFTALRRRRRA